MGIELFQLSAELEILASTVRMPSGAMLFRCGDPVTGVFLIRSGNVLLYFDEQTQPILHKTMGPGEIAGLPAALTGTYSLSAQVVEDAELGFVPADRVAALLERSPQMCMIAARAMSDEIARMRSGLKDAVLHL